MNQIQSVAATRPFPRVSRQTARRVPGTRAAQLRKVVILAAFLPPVATLLIDLPVFWFTRVMAATLWVLCLAPSYIYLRQHPALRRPIPFFPLISLVYGIYYVLPITLGVVDNYYNAPVNVETDYDYPVQLAFVGWGMMVAGYVVSGFFLRARRQPAQLRWDPRVISRIGLLLMFVGMAAAGLRVAFLSVISVGGVFQFLLGLQWVGTGLLVVLARRGELSRGKTWTLIISFVLTSAMMVANGSVAPMLMLFVVAGFALWIGKPEIKTGWIIAAFVALLTVSSLRGIAIDFRRETFGQSQSQTANLQLIARLLGDRIERDGLLGAVGHGLSMSAGRSANLDLFANVVRRTPSEIPYWRGETYKSLIGLAVPRILWPNKPMKGLGQEFGHRYRFLHSSNLSTSINLPVLVEFFINFGENGVLIGMLLVGVIYRILDFLVNRPRQPPILSMIGVSLMIPLLFIESDFSLIFGGLPLSGVAFFIVWLVLKKLLRPLPARARANAFQPSAYATIAGAQRT